MSVVSQLPPQVIIGLVVLVFVVLRHIRPHAATLPRLFIAPVVVLVVGLAGMAPYAHQLAQPTGPDLLFIAIDLALTLVMSVARAVSIRLEVAPSSPGPRRRAVHYRYGAATLALWAASLAVKVVLSAGGHAAGVSEELVTGSVLAILGLSVVAQNIVLWVRCRRLATAERVARRPAKKSRSTAATRSG